MKNTILKKNLIILYFMNVLFLLPGFTLNAKTKTDHILLGVTSENERTITGQVRDSNGLPIPGVIILVKGSPVNTLTDIDGQFSILVKEGDILVFNFMGMKKIEVTISNQSTLNINMEENVELLDEVVVTALGIKKDKKTLTYSSQDLKGSDVLQSRENNLSNSLSGKIAGLQVTNTSGAVGSSARIVIRGAKSLTGNSLPLFVVDGVPLKNSNSSTFSYGGVDYGNEISDIDPNNIESINILKGANASALYGSRAANGVVLITTKSANQDDNNFGATFNSDITVSNIKYIPRMQDLYGQGSNGEYKYVDGDGAGIYENSSSWGPRLDGRLIDQWTGPQQPWVPCPDNVKNFFQTGMVFNNSLSVYKNGKTVSTRIGYTDSREKGTLPNTDQTKNTLSFNTKVEVIKDLEVQLAGSFVHLQNDNLTQGGYNGNNFMSTVIWGGRQWDYSLQKDYKNPDGTQKNQYGPNVDNPWFIINQNTNSRLRNRLYGNLNVKYRINDWLNVLLRGGMDTYSESRKEVVDGYTISSLNAGSGGKFTQAEMSQTEMNMDAMLSINKTIAKNFMLDVDFGANMMNNKYRDVRITAAELVVPNVFNISNVKGNPTCSNYDSEYETQSLYGQFTLGYNNALFLNASARNDWASTLPKGNWSYFYPSAGVSVLFNELFKLESPVLSYSKVRINWAQVGNFAGPYKLENAYLSNQAWDGNPVFYASQDAAAGSGLKPELTSSLEVGLELNFFMNRLGMELTGYDATTKNQILNCAVSKASGLNKKVINAGKINNKGLELKLTGTPVQTKNFTWDIVLNWSKNKSKVLELYPGIDKYQIGSLWGCYSYAIPGGEYGEIWHNKFQRNEQGQVVIGGNGMPIKENDLSKLGSINPDWLAGLRNTFRYKNVAVSALLDIRQGSDVFSLSYRYACMAGVMYETAANNIRETGIVVPGVKQDGTPNDKNVTAEYYYGNLTAFEPWIFDGSFIKLRELSVNYDFPKKLLAKTNFFQKASIAFVGRNLALFKSNMPDGYDPEVSVGSADSGQGFEYGYIPTGPSYSFSIQFTF